MAQIPVDLPASGEPETGLDYVRRMLANAKRTSLLMLDAVARAYGDKVAEEQEALGLLADIAAETYALESAFLRTQKIPEERRELPLELTVIYACDAADRIAVNASNLAAALVDGAELATTLAELAPSTKVNTIATRRRIAAKLLEVRRYFL